MYLMTETVSQVSIAVHEPLAYQIIKFIPASFSGEIETYYLRFFSHNQISSIFKSNPKRLILNILKEKLSLFTRF